jgi:DNA-binding CsgD family transcriptional regulator
MMSSSTLVAADLRRMADAVDPSSHTGDGEFVPSSSLQAIASLIGADDVTFQVMDSRRRRAASQSVRDPLEDGATDELDPLFWDGFWDCLACSYPQRTGDYASVTRLSDFYGRAQLRRITMGRYLAGVGVRHELMLPLPPDGELDRRLLLFRTDGSDFSDRDVVTLHLLRPHLVALHLRQQRRAAGVPDLTPRQLQILTLVAAGCTNQQVARALDVSQATVRKHLENAYARLDVTSRTAAVAKVHPLTHTA